MKNYLWAIVLLPFLFACNDKKPATPVGNEDITWDMLGLKRNPEWAYQDDVDFLEPTMREVIPDSFDLRDLMKHPIQPPKQQSCGDCWAWSTHHGYEIAREVNEGAFFDHSIQTVLSCSNDGSCGGGDMGAVDFLKHGLPLEADFPYTGHDSRCKFSSADIQKGWDPHMIATPYIGSSLQYSRAMKGIGGVFSARPSVAQMQSAMIQYKAPLVVTVEAYNASGPGVVEGCSSINSGGNHMVTVIGWDSEGGHVNAHVYNSWGQGHGDHGISRIKWECGSGKLNHGLGVSAKVVEYKPACEPPAINLGKAKHILLDEEGASIHLGKKILGATCQWSPIDGLSDPNSCDTYASPKMNTEYHLVAKNACGQSSAMALVELWGPKGAKGTQIRTPSGIL